MNKLSKTLTMSFSAVALVVAAGCTSTSVNPTAKAIDGVKNFRDRVESIEPGDSYETVFNKLGIGEGQFSNLTLEMEDKDSYYELYGENSPPEGSRMDEYNRIEGYVLPYRDVKEKVRFGITHNKKETSGYELSTKMIFRNGAIVNDPSFQERDVNDSSRESNIKSFNPLKNIF